MSRGGFSGMTVVSNPSGAGTLTSVVNLVVAEPFWFSPLEQTGSHKGFTNIQTWQWNINISSFARMWSHDAINGNPISSIVGAWNSAPQMCFRYVTPKMPMDRLQLYPFNGSFFVCLLVVHIFD